MKKYYWYVISKNGTTWIANNTNIVEIIKSGADVLYAADRWNKCSKFIDWTIKYHNETMKQHKNDLSN